MKSKAQKAQRNYATSLMRRIEMPTPFRSEFITQLRYADIFQLTGDATPGIIGTEQTFRLNSLFDPDLTNSGHQPMGFDQIKPFYNSYQVMSVEVKYRWYASDSNGLMVFTTLQSGQNTSALAGTICSIAFERQEVLSHPLPIAGKDVITHTEHVPIHTLVGLSRQQYKDDPNYRSLCTTNPATQAYVRFAVGDTASGVSKKCTLAVEFVFHARFFDKINVGQS